jgi:hypothetical protein
MNAFNARRRTAVFLVAFGLWMTVPRVAAAAPSPMQKTGGVRTAMASNSGQTLLVTVTLDGKPVANATVAVRSSTGVAVASGTTSNEGLFSIPLEVGSYTVTATSAAYVATSNVTIMQSESPMAMTLTL